MKKLIFLFSFLLNTLFVSAQTYTPLVQNTTTNFTFNPFNTGQNCVFYDIVVFYVGISPNNPLGNVGTVTKTWPVNYTTYQHCNPYITFKGIHPGKVIMRVRYQKREIGDTGAWTYSDIYFYINITCSTTNLPTINIQSSNPPTLYNCYITGNVIGDNVPPVYVWLLNGDSVGTSYSHSFLNLICNDTISSTVTFNNYCYSGTAYSNNIITICTSIDNPILKSSIEIYPNPFTDNVNLKINALERSKTTIILTDVLGKVYENKEVKLIEGENNINLPINCPNGLYFLSLINNNGIITYKIIK